MPQQRNRNSIGDVRPSQLITTFGPGAIIDLQTMTVIVAGIDEWDRDEEFEIREPRLQHAVKVEKFYSARPSKGMSGTIPTYIFPRYQHCPDCKTLSAMDEGFVKYNARKKWIECTYDRCNKEYPRKFATTHPAPFIVACPSGHVDDFPWRNYVHGGSTSCQKRMKLESRAVTGSIADMVISCECGKTRSAGKAFGEERLTAIGRCNKRQPWLGINEYDDFCEHSDKVRAIQRGAANSWFPIVRSVLSIKEHGMPIDNAIDRCDKQVKDQIDSIDNKERLDALIEMNMFPSLGLFTVEEIWDAIQRRRGDQKTNDTSDNSLRWSEWLAFQDVANNSHDDEDFFIEPGEAPEAYKGCVARIVLARKLLEVRALDGFTRIDSVGVDIDDGTTAGIAPIFRNQQDWRPAIEVRGEGIFIQLDESAVSIWENKPSVQERAQAMAEKFLKWELERNPGSSPSFPGARYVLLHSLAHILIRQLSLDCGYSANSVRERIYSTKDPKRPMAGILLYTASPDSEGGLGGLVDLGNPKRFPDLLHGALQSAKRCSSDPLCADHNPDAHATINGAACHACILASETSCERFNHFLDRSFLVPTMASANMEFFNLSK